MAKPALCLIVTNTFPPQVGGAGEVYAALAIQGAGRVRVLCAASDHRDACPIPGWRAHDAAFAVPIERIAQVRPPMRPGRPGPLARLGELVVRARLFARVAAIARRDAIRVLCIADDETVGWLIRPAQRLLGMRVMLYSHGDDLAIRPGEARIRARRRRQFARAEAIVAVSEAAASGLGRVFGVPRARIAVIPNGFDPALFRPMPPDPARRASLGLPERQVVVTVARLVARKGVDRTLDAVASLRDFPALFYLVVGDGPDRAALQAQAARLGIGGRVVFAGAVAHDAVPGHLALGDIMVMPNRRLEDGEDEGFGLVFLEANACGKPVVAGRAGGAPEVVQDGQNGLLVDGNDPSDIASALRRLLADPALAQALAARGLATAQAATWAARAKTFLALCERLSGV